MMTSPAGTFGDDEMAAREHQNRVAVARHRERYGKGPPAECEGGA
jgi:hypothetical protein